MLRQPFIVGEWEVFPLEGRIVRDGRSERLRPKAMDVLCLLAASPDEVVERDTILSEVWGRTAVTDEPLTATIGELRRVLGDSRSNDPGNGRGNYRYVETIPKRGYRLVAEVSESASQQVAEADASSPEPVAAGRGKGGRTWMLAAGVLLVLVVAALAVWRYGGDDASAAPGSIAVLPFAVQGGAEADVYFGDGLAQEILTTLSTIGELRVVARHSAFEFRDRADDLAAIRDSLQVDAVLDGSIRRDRDRIRVNVQLVDAASGYNLWAQTYDRRIGDTFLLQTEIARAIASQLSVKLSAGSAVPAPRAPDGDAYIAYLHGRYLFETARDEAGLREAIRYLEEAVAADRAFAPAYSALAGAWMRLADIGAIPADDGYGRGGAQARQALELAPDLAEAHLLLGWMHLYYDWDWEEARRSLERALELAPGDGFVLMANAALNFHLGEFDRAVRLAAMATERDPLRASPYYNLAYFRYTAGDLEGAERALDRAEELVPGYPRAGLLRVQIDLERGNVALAGSRVEPNPILGPVADALIAEARGDREQALAAVSILERDHALTAPYQIAEVYAWLGETDLAFRWLERAWEARDPGMTDLKVDPLLEPLKGDPRYGELLSRMGFESSRVSP
jgi:serine/threonine-protein kinase